MKERLFQYGGLSVRLFYSDQYGWVTTTAELAKGCGVSRDTLERVCKKHNLVMKESVLEDAELAANLRLIPNQRGPKPKVFWTIEGMTFVAMYMGTETCEQFRNEVLRTIKSLEAQGFVSNDQVIHKLETLEKMVIQQQSTIERQQATIDRLSEIVLRQESELSAVRQAENHYASAASYGMHAAKKTKHLRIVN